MTDELVYAAQSWPTNAAMIADCHKLGYLKDDDYILDPTYGRGTWWRVWRPSLTGMLIGHVWREFLTDDGDDHWDFRAMWYNDEEFDAVAFDPPYVSVGGRSTSGLNGMHAAYGMDGAPMTPQGVQDDIYDGLSECFRVVKKGGIVLVKCQSYVTSGKLWPGLFLTWGYATSVLGFQLIDHLIHISGPRPQPLGRGPQKHARRNQSDLLILKRPIVRHVLRRPKR